METLAKHAAAKTALIGHILVIGVQQRPGIKLAQVLGWRLQDGGGIQFSSSEATGIGVGASAPGTRALDRSRSFPRL